MKYPVSNQAIQQLPARVLPTFARPLNAAHQKLTEKFTEKVPGPSVAFEWPVFLALNKQSQGNFTIASVRARVQRRKTRQLFVLSLGRTVPCLWPGQQAAQAVSASTPAPPILCKQHPLF